MNFVYAAIIGAISFALVALAVLIPRQIYFGKLRRQVQTLGGHIFSPDKKTWQNYLTRTANLWPLLSILAYSALLTVLIVTKAGQWATAASIGLGFYLLLRNLLQTIPPTYGITGKGITIISWLPGYPLGPYGSGSKFIPWQKVEVCAVDNLFFTVLTERQEARVVYPPELEERVCTFIDKLLRKHGYRADAIR